MQVTLAQTTNTHLPLWWFISMWSPQEESMSWSPKASWSPEEGFFFDKTLIIMETFEWTTCRFWRMVGPRLGKFRWLLGGCQFFLLAILYIVHIHEKILGIYKKFISNLGLKGVYVYGAHIKKNPTCIFLFAFNLAFHPCWELRHERDIQLSMSRDNKRCVVKKALFLKWLCNIGALPRD